MMGGRVTLLPGPVNDIRAQFGAIFAGVEPLLPPPTDAVKTEDVQIEKDQRVRIYIPAGMKDPLPVGLYIHCGGWFSGSIEGEDHLCRNIAEKSNIILFSPTYRLAPEYPYPAGLDDCCTAYEWMHVNASKFGGDATKKFIMGGSAGGNLTACVGLKYASNPEFKPSGLIIACPQICDVNAFPGEYKKRFTPEKYVDSPMIGREIMLQAASQHTVAPFGILHF
jgi:versiconal hemiacetal acetate esterase